MNKEMQTADSQVKHLPYYIGIGGTPVAVELEHDLRYWECPPNPYLKDKAVTFNELVEIFEASFDALNELVHLVSGSGRYTPNLNHHHRVVDYGMGAGYVADRLKRALYRINGWKNGE